jgi:Flp pilus assembly protein CpaB
MQQPKSLTLIVVAIGCGLVAAQLAMLHFRDNPPGGRVRGVVVSVVVARKAIPAGTEINAPEEWFKIVRYLKGDVPQGAFGSLDDLKGRVVQRPLAEDQPVKATDLSGK